MTRSVLMLKLSYAWWIRWLLIPMLGPIGAVASFFGDRGRSWAVDRVVALASRGLRCEVKKS